MQTLRSKAGFSVALFMVPFLPLHASPDEREIVRQEAARRAALAYRDASNSAAREAGRGPLATPPTITQEAKLIGVTRASGDSDGWSVSVSGNTALVAGHGDAYVFVRSGNTWTLQATLTPGDGSFGAFGWSVVVDGDTALVGAWLADGARSYTGAAYVFVRNGSTWTLQAKLFASDGDTSDYFGYQVSLSGNTALVGAPENSAKRGAAYVFVRNGTLWSQQAKLVPADAVAGDEVTYPRGAAVNGDTVILGSYSQKKVAYAFVRNGIAWIQQAKLLPTGSSVGFGWNVAVNGDTAVTNTGDVYSRVGGVWQPQAPFTTSYMTSVAFDGIRAIAGNTGDIGLVGAGAAYVYHRSAGTWIQDAKLAASDGSFADLFGWSVAVSGDSAVVGAPNDDNLGSAYAFRLPSTTNVGSLRFVPVPPCRLMETRPEYNFEGRTGAFGPPFLRAGETRTLTVSNSNVCQIPASARAFVLNATLIPRGPVDFVTLWPGGESRPNFWSVRSPDGQIVANQAIVNGGSTGAFNVYVSNDADLLIDISGYFTDSVSGGTNLTYYPLTPCRVVDTRIDYRSPPGPFGPPTMSARATRRFAFPATPYCFVPPGATAYSVTLTAVPPQPLAYLTVWPSGGAQPNVSSINSFAGRILANNIIVPASGDGSIDVFAFDRTDFLMDINGYFAPDNGTGLYYYPVSQCRASDSTSSGGIYGDDTTRTINVPTAGNCTGIATSAKGYVVNVTAIPSGSPMPFITAYPTGQPRPNASILNAFEGQTVTNTAIVPSGANGAIDIYAYRRTHVVVDVSGYFGR